MGSSVEDNSDGATNEMSCPGSPPTLKNLTYSLPAKKRFLNFMSSVKSPSPSKSLLKTDLGKYLFKLKIKF